MDEVGIRQWNVYAYWEVFPRTYYAEAIARGELDVLRRGDALAAAVVLPREDSFWSDDIPAYYIHNLVTDRSFPGAGRILLEHCMTLARRDGKKVLRLDCARDNDALNAYYDCFGFRPVGTVTDGPYEGTLRELSVN